MIICNKFARGLALAAAFLFCAAPAVGQTIEGQSFRCPADTPSGAEVSIAEGLVPPSPCYDASTMLEPALPPVTDAPSTQAAPPEEMSGSVDRVGAYKRARYSPKKTIDQLVAESGDLRMRIHDLMRTESHAAIEKRITALDTQLLRVCQTEDPNEVLDIDEQCMEARRDLLEARNELPPGN